MTWKSRAAYGFLVGAALFASFGAGYRVRAQGEASGWMPPGENTSMNLVRTADGTLMVDAKPTAATTTASTTKRTYKPNLKPYETLEEVRRAIRDNFVRTKVTDEELTHGAVRGMLRALGDRFTRFLTPEDYAKFTEQNNAEFVGIGARIDLKDDYMGSADAKPFGASRPYIVEPIEGGPAEKLKLQKDDVILAVDGRSTADMSEDAVVSRIRGVRGTPVKLKIERKTKGAQLNRDVVYKVFDITLTRDIIAVRPVKLEWLPNRVAWLRLDEFNKKTDAEMGEAMAALRKGPNGQGMARGLILDMRDNPGGLLDVAVDVGSRFISDGPIVYTRERDGSERALSAQRKHFMNLKIPVVVLINNYSASAAEIVTGAMKDKGVATVVGEPSYGKASVQVLLELKNGGALVITTAKYLTPAKLDISDKGVAPDIMVKASDEDGKTGRGAQLDKAIQIITDKTALPAVAAATEPAKAVAR